MKKESYMLLAPEVEEELVRFEDNIKLLRSGRMDPNEFKKFRLNNGVYGIRGETDLQMIRIKCPHGEITSDQLDVVAELTEKFTRTKMAHVTTRQAIQIHHVHLDNIPLALRRLAECGLTSREACGNTVRNVTKTPYAGFLKDEVFDVTPYAQAIFEHFLRNPAVQNFPRKFKIAFYGGGSADIAYTAIHDLGYVAAKRVVNGKEEKGFRIYVGGGLGATPHSAILLEEFTPLSDFFSTADAITRIFDRHGDRKDKFHARLKFVVKKFGDDVFRQMVIEERSQVRATRAGGWKWVFPIEKPLVAPVLTQKVGGDVKPDAAFELWRKTNVLPQKQEGFSMVTVVTPLGDLTVPQMRTLANIARKYNAGQLRTMVQQNMFLPWIRNEHLVALYAELKAAGLGSGGALRLSDVTRCPGADTCQIAVTKSRGLAGAILELFKNGLAQDADMNDLAIKISGCTNSCGQHHIGNIGFFGTYRKVNGHEVPHYQLLIGGDVKEGEAKFGQPINAIPAKRAPEVVKHLVGLYKKEKQGSERFVATMERLGRVRLKEEIEPFRSLPPFEEKPDMYYEWGEYHEFKAEIGQGECAA
ncbi:MAG: Sulfite reductase [ferredoxin] [Elusimicrobia bacterium]|nr:Sulfite reductase [ferredoxin] [Elusimicrobiota bacterium]